MNKIIFGGLAIAMLGAGPVIAGDSQVRAQDSMAMAETCRLPSAASATLFECPGLSLYFGAMSIQRNKTDGVIATPPTGTPGTLMTGDDFTFSRSTSPDMVARFRFGGGWSIEGRYFSSHPSNATYGIPTVTTFRTAGIGVTILGGGSVDGAYNSSFASAELNMWKELIPGISVGVGYRHLDLNENLFMAITSPGIYNDWNDTNSLNGMQGALSFAFAMQSIPLHLNAAFKGGIYTNSASNNFTSAIVSSSLGNVATKQSLSAEADLTATYYMTSRLSLSANYMALWLNNVALAPPAAQTTTQIAGGTSSPLAYGTVLYNAVSVRLGYDF